MQNTVLIVGAGPAGLCLSLALAERGLEVDLIERRSREELAAPEFDGREIALAHPALRLLHELGVWQHLAAEDAWPLRRARIMDGSDPGFEVDGAAFDREWLGQLVSNQRIRAVAWQAVANEPRIRVHAGVAVEAIDSDATIARARLSDGQTLEAPLLVAADSRFSANRRAMGIPAYMRDFGASMLVCRMQHTGPNDDTAWEWFGHGQTRALLPLGEHLSSVVLTVSGAEAQALTRMTPEAFAADMTARYEARLGEMTLASTRHAHPLVATWVRRFVARRFALAGDAAVGMHPVTAHGFNLGLASVEHLAQAAADGLHRHDDPGHPALLARYQRRHRNSSALLFAGTQTVVGLFTNDRAPLQPLRHAIMRVGQRVPLLRRALVAGLLEETPRPTAPLRHLRTGLDVLRPRLRGKVVQV